MANPILVETTRIDGRGGEIIENLHRGAICAVGADGEVLWEVGDASTQMLPRSSAKPIQALALVESGAADAMRLTPAHLALACASHVGSAAHIAGASEMLAAAGLSAEALQCGADMPEDREERAKRRETGPEAICHQCSGKRPGGGARAR